MVLAFTLGGREAVEALRLARTYGHTGRDQEQFYQFLDDGKERKPTFKPAVEAWLTDVDAKMSLEWVSDTIQVIRVCLHIEPSQRCTARDLSERLDDVVRLCQEHPWQGTKIFGVDGKLQSTLLRENRVGQSMFPREEAPTFISGVSGASAVIPNSGYGSATPKDMSVDNYLLPSSKVPATPEIVGGLAEPQPAVPQTVDVASENDANLHNSVILKAQSDTERDVDTIDLDDTRSFLSIADIVGSQVSSTASDLVSAGEKVIIAFLAHNPQLKPLHEEALRKMEADCFVDKYRRVWKVFYVDLTQTASARLQKELVRILENRTRRTTIAQNIFDFIKPPSEQIGLQNLESLHLDRVFLEDWLANKRDSANSEDAIAPDTNIADHESKPDDLEQLKAPIITGMQEYLMEGPPFQKLLFNIHTFLLRKALSSLTRVLMTMPNGKVWITQENDNSVLNAVKIMMEKFSGEQWHWWPFRAPLHPLQQGQVRINWLCHCDTHLWAEVAKPLAERRKAKVPAPVFGYVVSSITHDIFLYTFLLFIGVLSGCFFMIMKGYSLFRQSRAISKIDHGTFVPLLTQQHEHGSDSERQLSEDSTLAKRLDPSGAEPSRVKITPDPFGTNQAAGISGNQAPSGAQASSQGATSPPHAPAGSSSHGLATSPTKPGMSVSTSVGAAPALSNSRQKLQTAATLVKLGLFVFFVVKGARRTLELAEINAKNHKDDGTYFKELRTQYKELRGFWRRWFSVWRLKHCNFVKFQKIRANRFLYHKDDIPDDPAYEYSPKPPDDVPPITPHEFELALDHCGDRCIWSMLHDCVEPPIGLYALHRIPKRNSTIHRTTDDPEFAWGIQAKHIPSFVRILAYHILIISGTFGFWVWWQAHHPQDLSNAGIPASVLVALISLFWALSAVPKMLREPV